MSTPDTKQQMYMNKLNIISNQVSSLLQQLNNLNGRVNNIDNSLNRLPTRIQQIRKSNYRVMKSLESEVATLANGWSTIKPNVSSIIGSSVPILVSEGRTIENELTQKRLSSNPDVSQLSNIEIKVATLNTRTADLISRVSGATGEIANKLQSIDHDVSVAERTISLTTNSSFQWKQNESPILSVNAKDMNNDVEGILSFTNQRFIFESEKEVVLKKTLFIATQKKKVRETTVDKPIGMIDNIVKGRVGILAGQGLYVTFKPNSGQQEMKLDTKGDDTDLVLRFHQFINSGAADQELAPAEDVSKEKQKPVPIICPRCGAPYSEEIYRGQTSLQCKYCSSIIPLSR